MFTEEFYYLGILRTFGGNRQRNCIRRQVICSECAINRFAWKGTRPYSAAGGLLEGGVQQDMLFGQQAALGLAYIQPGFGQIMLVGGRQQYAIVECHGRLEQVLGGKLF